MKSRSLIMLLVIVAFACGLLIVNAQEPDEDVRGAFLSTRPKTTNQNAPRRRRSQRNTNSSASSTTAKNANAGSPANPKNYSNQNSSTMNGPVQAIGLGYTLYMRDANGRSVRVEPGREFHNGDRVRISLEPNVDGFLYVFHTEDNGPAEMTYPDALLY